MGFIPSGMGIQGMMSALTATVTPMANPGSWTPPKDPNDPMAWLDNFGGGVADMWQQFLQSPQTIGWLFSQLGGAGVISGQPDAGSMAGATAQMEQFNQQNLLQKSRSYRFAYAKGQNMDLSSPAVQQWVTNGGTQPAPPQAVPTTTPGTATTPTAGTTTTAGAALVPTPFPYSMYHNPDQKYGYNFGDKAPPHSYPSGIHEGQDYQVADGTSLISPFTGKVKYVGYDPAGYGNYVDIQFGDQGLFMRFSHLQFVNVRAGDSIKMGDRFGVSGSTGYSTGPHLLVELRNAQNQALDPRPLLNEIFNDSPTGAGNGGKGITVDALAATGAISTGGANTQYETTPDGHVLYDGTQDRAYYDMINKEYVHRYGKNAPYSMALAMQAAGVTNTSQMAAVAANWPSDIPGMTFDQRDNVFNTANGIAMKNYGRPIPDSLVKRLAAEGLTSPGEIQQWFLTHVSADLPAPEYQQVFDAVNPAIHNAYKSAPPPDYIDSIHKLVTTKGYRGTRAPGKL